jgi:hypothetical protein
MLATAMALPKSFCRPIRRMMNGKREIEDLPPRALRVVESSKCYLAGLHLVLYWPRFPWWYNLGVVIPAVRAVLLANSPVRLDPKRKVVRARRNT